MLELWSPWPCGEMWQRRGAPGSRAVPVLLAGVNDPLGRLPQTHAEGGSQSASAQRFKVPTGPSSSQDPKEGDGETAGLNC